MTQEIGDKAAIEFSVGFYDALGAGRSVDFAYRFGCSAIALAGIQESLTPILIQKADTVLNDDNPTPDDIPFKEKYFVPDIPSEFNAFHIGKIVIPVAIALGTPSEPINVEDVEIIDKFDILLEEDNPKFKQRLKNLQKRLLEIQEERYKLKGLSQAKGIKVRINSFSQAPEREGDKRGLITFEFSRVEYKTLYSTNLALDIPIKYPDGQKKTIRELYCSHHFTDLSESILANPGNVDVAVICGDKDNRQLIIRQRKKGVSLYRDWYQVSATGYMDPDHINDEGDVSPFVTAAREANQEIADSLDAKPSDFKLIGLAVRWIDLYPAFFGYIETNKSAKQLNSDFCRDGYEGNKSQIPFTPESVLEHIANNKWVAISALCAISTLLKFYPRKQVEEVANKVKQKNWRDYIE